MKISQIMVLQKVRKPYTTSKYVAFLYIVAVYSMLGQEWKRNVMYIHMGIAITLNNGVNSICILHKNITVGTCGN